MSASSDSVLCALDAARRGYVAEWDGVNSANLAADGLYDWMADFVAGCRRVLEVGIGGGTSTTTLLRRGHSVVGLDENPLCLEKAESRLRAEGYSVVAERRGHAVSDGDHYSIEYAPVRGPAGHADAYLVEGNILADRALVDWLKRGDAFDAVVCWLAGGHKLIRRNTRLPALVRACSAQIYRICLQDQVYSIANEVLRRKGVLSLVDRGDEPDDAEDMSRLILEMHVEQARHTCLQPYLVNLRPYHDLYLNHTRGVKITRPGAVEAGGPEAPKPRSVMIGVLARKS